MIFYQYYIIVPCQWWAFLLVCVIVCLCLQGSVWSDCLYGWCCYPLSWCQISREIKRRAATTKTNLPSSQTSSHSSSSSSSSVKYTPLFSLSKAHLIWSSWPNTGESLQKDRSVNLHLVGKWHCFEDSVHILAIEDRWCEWSERSHWCPSGAKITTHNSNTDGGGDGRGGM